MAFFNSKLRYALCAAVDMAMQSSTEACQSREIAARQNIPGPYLDQILASLKGAGLVRSIRGAGGGYNLAKPPEKISVGDVVRALLRNEKLFSNAAEESCVEVNSPGIAWIVRDFEENVETFLSQHLDRVTLAELAQRKNQLDDSLSMMPSI